MRDGRGRDREGENGGERVRAERGRKRKKGVGKDRMREGRGRVRGRVGQREMGKRGEKERVAERTRKHTRVARKE